MNNVPNYNTGRRLASLRMEHGYSRPELAEKLVRRNGLPVTWSMVKNWEEERVDIPFFYIIQLAFIYDINLDYFV